MNLFQLGGVMLVMAVHRHRLVMGMAVGMIQMLMIQPAIAAMEGHQELAPGIEAGHARRDQQQGEGIGADAGMGD